MALLEIEGAVPIPDEETCKSIIEDYSNDMRIPELTRKYHLDLSTIKKVFLEYDVQESRRKTKLNDDYFNVIDSEEKAYWLGFLMADGYNNEKEGKIEISLKSTDRYLLELFNKHIESDYKISKKKIGKHEAVRLTIRSQKMSKDLSRHGCVQAKSLILQFPKVPLELEHHFLRGYFDGDGSVSVNESKRMYKFHLIGTEDFLTKARQVMGMQEVKMYQKGSAFDLAYGGKGNLVKLYNYLYQDAANFLQRKHDVFVRCQSLPS